MSFHIQPLSSCLAAAASMQGERLRAEVQLFGAGFVGDLSV